MALAAGEFGEKNGHLNAQFPLVAEVEEVEPKDVVGDAVIKEDEVKDDEL